MVGASQQEAMAYHKIMEVLKPLGLRRAQKVIEAVQHLLAIEALVPGTMEKLIAEHGKQPSPEGDGF